MERRERARRGEKREGRVAWMEEGKSNCFETRSISCETVNVLEKKGEGGG